MNRTKPSTDSAYARDSLLSAKLRVPAGTPSEAVSRPRLSERLNEGLKAKLTVVCAPAGYGKSTAAGQWARRLPSGAGWVSLDEGDNELWRFWTYVVAAIETASPGFAPFAAKSRALPGEQSPEPFLTSLIKELERMDEPLVLVLDDFHCVSDVRILKSVAFFVEYTPENVHLYLIGRSEPKIPLSRLESRRMAVRLEAEELRFNENEGEEFFRRMGVAVSADESGMLVERTEGWIAAMQLAAISLRDAEDVSGFVCRFSGEHRRIEEYLLEEAFLRQPEELREFLVECSVLKRMNSSLCRAATGNERSGALLEAAVKSNLFLISLDDTRRWYRFHRLFSDFLRRKLSERGPDVLRKLYSRVAEWSREQGLGEEAMDYYLAAGMFESALELAEELIPRMEGGEWPKLRQWLSSVPNEALLAYPSLFFSSVLNDIFERDSLGAARRLELALQWQREHAESWSDEANRRYLGLYFYSKGFYSIQVTGDFAEGKSNFERSWELIPNAERLLFELRESPVHVSILRSRGSEPGSAGRDRSVAYMNRMQEIFSRIDGARGKLHLSYAEVLYLWGELDEAERYALSGLEMTAGEAVKERLPGMITLVRARKAQGHLAEAERLLLDFRKDAERTGDSSLRLYLDTELARFGLDQRDRGMLKAWLRQYGLSTEDSPSAYQLYEYQFLARVLLDFGRLEEADRLLGALYKLA